MAKPKRRSQRIPMFKVCRYTIEGRDYADLSTNISAQGIFIKNFEPPPIGTDIILTVKLPEEWGNLPLQVKGRVVHVNVDSDPHKRGMGIEFVSVVADSLPIIEYFIREVFGENSINYNKLNQQPAAGGTGKTSYQYQVDERKKPS